MQVCLDEAQMVECTATKVCKQFVQCSVVLDLNTCVCGVCRLCVCVCVCVLVDGL